MGGGSFTSGISSGSGGSPPLCDAKLAMTVRDFSKSHSDFESFVGSTAYTGLVESSLGIDGTPTYAHPGSTPQTTGPQAFAHWYHDVPGVNETFAAEIALFEAEPGVFVYESAAFFPIDNMGFGNEGFPNNFHFTTEVHTSFEYKGGEIFTFTGDDDLWLFINGRLAIDLGGLHPELSESVTLDAQAAQLGITIGNAYPMDIFHAERHTDHSNFRIETTIDCFKPVDPK
jgi:fibro-slime domain-containing protein